ncbi:MAG: DNA alkylation repair protein [Methanomicrobiaceae archaeon]|nr:DNA alkylation repair protein [Methanomicrobiaceae archaeon]
MTREIVSGIRAELQAQADESIRESAARFFKEEVKCYGLRTAAVRTIATRYFQEIRDRDKQEIFGLCEELLESGYMEEAFIAYDWADRVRARFVPEDFSVLERWLFTSVSNWAECDTLCNHAIGSFIEQYPEFIGRLEDWTRSENRWVRRGAAVTLVLPARKGRFLKEIFAIADLLLTDPDDLVQKGYGWMLKEASKAHRDAVFEYVMSHKDVMPRTALRYAIEKMPPEMRKRAMER